MKKDWNTLKRFFLLFRPHWALYGISALMVSCRNLFITWLTAFISSRVLEVVLQGGGESLARELGLFALLLIAFVAFDTLGLFLQTISIQKIRNTLQGALFAGILSAPVWETGTLGQRGELLTRVNQDVDTAAGLLSFGLVMPAMYLISGIGATIVIGRESLLLCGGLYLLGLLSLFAQNRLAKSARKTFSAVQEDTSRSLGVYLQTITRSPDLRMAGLQETVSRSFQEKMKDFRRHTRRQALLQGGSGGLSQGIQYLGFFGAIALSLALYLKGSMTLPGVVLASQMASLILTMILTLSSSLSGVHTSLSGIDRLFQVVDLPREELGGRELKAPASDGALILARDLSCTFKDGTTPFSSLNLSIPAGSVTALRGESGCGKTTLMRLLLKLYPYDGGSLQIFGEEVGACSASSIRGVIGYLPQQNALFSGTLRENLLLGISREVGDEEIHRLLGEIGADSWVNNLEKALDTPLVEGGANLSGGQCQMVAIARGILSRKPVLILDEAFAGVDREHIGRIIGYLKERPQPFSALIVTHDEEAAALCHRQLSIG